MKTQLTKLFFCILQASVLNCTLAQDIPDISITISTVAGPAIRFPSNKRIKVMYENKSNMPIGLDLGGGLRSADLYAKVSIFNEQGKPIERLAMPSKIEKDGSLTVHVHMGRTFRLFLTPGNPIEDSFVLNATYDLRNPGKYKMFIERTLANQTIKSNELVLEVGQPLEPWEIEIQKVNEARPLN